MHLSSCSFTLSKCPSILPFHAQAVMLTLVWHILLVCGNSVDAYPFKCGSRRSRLQIWKMSKILEDKRRNNYNKHLTLPQNLAAHSAYQKQRPTGAMNVALHNQNREVLFKCSHRGEAREMLLFFCSFNQRTVLFHVSNLFGLTKPADISINGKQGKRIRADIKWH